MKMVHSRHVALLFIAHVLLLPSLNAVIFDCQMYGDGDHPHPSDCSKFIRCYGLDQNEYDCTPGMLFSASERRCEPLETVTCITQSRDNDGTTNINTSSPELPHNTDIDNAYVFLPVEEETIFLGSDIWITCEVFGEQFVGWYAIKAAEEKIGENGRRRVETLQNIAYYLVIQNVQRSDEGIYTCRGSSQERNFTLHIGDDGTTDVNNSPLQPSTEADPSVQIPAAEEHHYEGSNVSAECLVTGDKFVGWYTPKGDRVGDKGRIRLETYGEGDFHLVIDTVTEDDEGNYTCRCAQRNATYQLHVVDESEFSIDKDISENSTDTTYSVFLPLEQDWAFIGSDVWITCEMSGEPFVGWYAMKAADEKIGEKGRRRVETPNNNTYYLVIRNVQRSDEGIYTCRGSSQERNFTLHVEDDGTTDVNNSPLQPSTDVDTTYSVFLPLEQDWTFIGSDVWITCEVSGEPFVGWYAMKAADEKIGTTGRRRVETTDNIAYYLVIENVQRGDEGIYTCRSSSHEKHFTLHVEDDQVAHETSDQITQIVTPEEYHYEGSDVSAECLVTGDTFDGWYTPKGDRVGDKGRIRLETFGEGDFHLVIDTVTKDDEGNYTCRCAQSNATYQLHVLDNTEPSKERATAKPVVTAQESFTSNSTSEDFTWGSVRLAGGLHPREGRVEVWYDGIWGTICDSGWDMNEARVICRMLGYPRALSATRKPYYTITQGKVWLDNVVCSGNENSLLECQHEVWGKVSCNTTSQAGVRCGGKTNPVTDEIQAKL